MGDTGEQYEELRGAYKRAEDAIHNLGIEGEGVDTSALNELRYTGYHVLQAITASSDDERDEQLQRAKRHCERALYDAYDSAIFFRLWLFQEFQKDYAKVVVSDVVSNYLDLIRTMREAKSLLDKARDEKRDRADFYEEAATIYPRLVSASNTLEDARDDLNKKGRELATARNRWWIHIGISLLTGLIAATAVVVTSSEWPWF